MSYIHESARESYRHWWEQQTHWLFWSYGWRQHVPSVSEEIGYLYPEKRKPRWRRYRYGSHTRYMRPWDISTSGESSFVQSGYAKKELSDVEQARKDWREHKQIKRDRAKTRRRYYNAGPYGKRMVHRSRRQRERECISHGRYDEISQGVQDEVRMWWD